ncbi:7-cyano-7-deazaguanine synthase [Spirillospora sp. NPDC050679]
MPRDRITEYWDGDSGRRELRWNYDLHSSFTTAAHQIAEAFPAAAADLWDIASSCYAVDRRVRRTSANGGPLGHAWSRDLRVRLAVRVPDLWEGLRRPLEKLLYWLTCDTWRLEFQDGSAEIPGQHVQLRLTEWPENRIAALFSGGLDSTVGLIHDLRRREADCLVSVSVATGSAMRNAQEGVLDGLRARPGTAQLESVPFKLHLSPRRNGGERRHDEENTQRTRGLVFLSAGVATALAAGCPRLRVYENGIGAINLPCTWGQVGAQAARPVHPRTIALMQGVVDEVAAHCGRTLTIETPHARRTKAQMIRDVPPEFDQALRASVSCDSGYTYRHRSGDPPHCGGCTSCLLRRQALIAGGRAEMEAETSYRETPGSKRDHLPAMLWQTARLAEALSTDAPWPELVQEFPDLLCVPDALRESVQDELLGLYREYVREWSLPQVVERLEPGHSGSVANQLS